MTTEIDMASLNKAMIIGNVGADPELRYTAGGQAVITLSVATSDRWKDKDGNEQDRTEWHKIVVWGKQAESCGKYVTKGKQILVEGRIQTRKYDDKEGVTRYATEIVADKVTFLGGGSNSSEDGPSASAPKGSPKISPPSAPKAGGKSPAKGGFDDSFSEDDIPF